MIFSECEHHFCGWLHPRVCIIVRTVLTSIFSTSWRNLKLTDSSASCGHSWNQSIAVQFTTAGNFLLRTLSLLPTGEKHRATCSAHTRTHTHTHTARSNRIECEVWYSSEIIVIFCFSVSTTRVTVSCGKYRQGTPALIITSSWSRGANGKVWINYLQLHH